MLNIGPRTNGDVPFEIEQRLLEMGKWLEINGESIYGAQAFDLPKDQHDWGKITSKKTKSGTKIYLHIFNWPLNKELYLTGIKTKPEKIYLLADQQKSPIKFDHSEVLTTIQLNEIQPDPYVSVIVLEYNDEPAIEKNLVGKTVDGGFSMTPQNQNSIEETLIMNKKERGGTVPEHTLVKEKKSFRWKIYVDETREKTVDISYSFQSDSSKSKLSVIAADVKLMHKIVPTGKTIGEPNQNWIIDNFKSTHLGKINFPEKGIYIIELEIMPENDDELKFQWVWVH